MGIYFPAWALAVDDVYQQPGKLEKSASASSETYQELDSAARDYVAHRMSVIHTPLLIEPKVRRFMADSAHDTATCDCKAGHCPKPWS